MILNSETLGKLRVGFSAAYQRTLGQATALSSRIATNVPASQMEQTYGWLGKVPNVREWIGPRAVQNISESDYTIKERPWELTIGVNRDHIETDNLGMYTPLFEEMGSSTAAFKEQLIWGLLKDGFNTPCYDGQNFFDTDHPVQDEDGNATSVSNSGGGAGAPWFLLDVSRSLKPIILQTRRDFGDIVARDKATDDNVFDLNEFRYGVDARLNVGFGFWQFAYGSKQDLTPENYEAARVAMTGVKGDGGRPLGIMPSLLVVPPALEGKARRLLVNEKNAAGADNEWKGTAEPLVVPWLA